MAQYRKKPVVIDAIQFNGKNYDGVFKWADDFPGDDAPPMTGTGGTDLLIQTSEGTMRADPGDWVIRGIKGEFYPCKPDIFAATYEAVDA